MQQARPAESEIGYVVKSYPRLSETFIANEVYLLEQRGLRLRLFSLLDVRDAHEHAVVAATRAPVLTLPQCSAQTDVALSSWWQTNWPPFAAHHLEVERHRPQAYADTLALAWQWAQTYREHTAAPLVKSFLKEFLQAGWIATEVLRRPALRHLHAHFCHTSTTVTLFVSALTGLPFSFTAHAKDIYVPTLNPGDLLTEKLRRARFAVTCTQANARHLAALNHSHTPLYTIYHGLDTEQFAPPSARPNHQTNADAEATVPVILSVGRIVEKKGFPTLLRACQLLKERGIAFHCRLVSGGGVGEPALLALLNELQLHDVVTVQPAVTQEALQAIFHAATVFALPSQLAENGDRDGIPNVLVEALASGLPVVSTHVASIPELIEDGVSGLLVPPQDAPALAAALAALLANPALRAQFAAAGRARICQHFDARANVRRLHEIFSAALTGAPLPDVFAEE